MKPIAGPPNRSSVSQNGTWFFQPDPLNEGETLGFHESSFADDAWIETPVPSCFNRASSALEGYEGRCWYRRAFDFPPPADDRLVSLRFEAVNNRAAVWLDGERLGENVDPFLPFEFDVTPQLRSRSRHTIAVCADNAHHEGDVPGMHVGWFPAGGITRDVTLEVRPRVRVTGVFVRADHRGGFQADIDITDAGPPAASGAPLALSLRARITAAEGPPIADLGEHSVTLARVPNGGVVSGVRVVLDASVPGVHAWSPATPVLYRLVVELLRDGAIVETFETTFGFRTIVSRGGRLLLNGEPIHLTGFNRHEDSPRTDMAQDLALARHDLERMKASGANTVRMCHYPHHPAEIAMCDELGLLVFAEVPLYFWNDEAEGRRTNAARVASARRQLERMIERDRNHPSVVIWSVSNETHEEIAEVAASNRELIRHVRAIDPTRLAVHVSDKWSTFPNADEDDVVCVNAYPSIARLARGDADPERSAHEWRDRLAALHDRYPDKPILVTEFGSCSIADSVDQGFSPQTHARVIEAEAAGMTAEYVCGTLVWCWADHPWPPHRFFQGYSMSPFGVVTRDREALPALAAARAIFRARQGVEPDAPTDHETDTEVTMIRETMDALPDRPFPRGYSARPMVADDVALWTDIQRDAEPYFHIDATLFRGQFGYEQSAIGERCFIVEDERELGVGTISAWRDTSFRGATWGRIHWVALRPSHQGKGLGRAMLAYAMRVLAGRHDRAYLSTDTRRVAAIKIYLESGFVPDYTLPGARERWGRFERETGIAVPRP